MNRGLVGVMVALMLVGAVVLTSGCGQSSTPATTPAAQQGGGGGGGGAAADNTETHVAIPDAQLQSLLNNAPNPSDWKNMPADMRKQLEEYAKTHKPQTAGGN